MMLTDLFWLGDLTHLTVRGDIPNNPEILTLKGLEFCLDNKPCKVIDGKCANVDR